MQLFTLFINEKTKVTQMDLIEIHI